MKTLGIVAIIAGLLLIVVNLAGLTGGVTAPQLVIGAIVAIIGIVLMRRPARKV